uniref:Carbohydrate-binding module family 96 domain-containing protein n=1 Tax=viral metagenome TaxID=1070528 RepID=A0A6M3K4T6_9ZZZZ
MLEIIEKRTEDSKTYSLGDNKYRAVIGVSHYKNDYNDPEEIWKDIDLTIKDGKLTTAPYDLTIGETIFYRDKKTGSTVTITPSKVGSKKSKLADFNIVPLTNGFKLQREIKSDKDDFDSEFDIAITGEVQVRSEATDANNEPVLIECELKDKKLKEVVKPTKETKYPVKVDPTFTNQAATADTQLVQNAATTNYGTGTSFYIRSYNSNRNRRALVQFYVVWGTNVPAGAHIYSSTLGLYYASWGVTDPVGRTFLAERLLRLTWVETEATWNIWKAANNWTTGGCGGNGTDYSSVDAASTTVPASPGWMTWDITEQTKYVQENATNYVACRISDSAEDSATDYQAIFYSAEHATEATRPLLTIDYLFHGVLEAQYYDEPVFPNRIYMIGRDRDGNMVYGTDSGTSDIAESGIRFLPYPDDMVITTADAASVAANVRAKLRLEADRGEITVYPNIGSQIWDALSTTDSSAYQSGAKYRVAGYRIVYDKDTETFQQTIKLTGV